MPTFVVLVFHFEMQSINQPCEKLHRIASLANSELLGALRSDGLQKFVRTHVVLKVYRVVDLLEEICQFHGQQMFRLLQVS